jgi:ArsR family transcriptional regulator
MSALATAAAAAAAGPTRRVAILPDATEQGSASCCAPVESPIREEEAARSAAVLRALGDPNRLRMLALIAAQPAESPLCACDVESGFDLSQPTISHHLKVLREAGLISVKKRGLWHYYSVRPEGLKPVRELLGLFDRAHAAP